MKRTKKHNFFIQKQKRGKENNKISRLQYDTSNWHLEHNEIYKVAQNYFLDLFSTFGPNMIDQCLDGVGSRVSDEINYFLTCPFNALEVKKKDNFFT